MQAQNWVILFFEHAFIFVALAQLHNLKILQKAQTLDLIINLAPSRRLLATAKIRA
mgnify:CR=1 FL=1